MLEYYLLSRLINSINMEAITTIAAIIAAVASVFAVLSSERNSKRYIYKRLERLEKQLRKIDWQLHCKYGYSLPHFEITPLDKKRERVVSQIEKLKRLL